MQLNQIFRWGRKSRIHQTVLNVDTGGETAVGRLAGTEKPVLIREMLSFETGCFMKYSMSWAKCFHPNCEAPTVYLGIYKIARTWF